MTTRGLFVTGTDTGVGKTTVACNLVAALGRLGHRAVGMKPVASGIERGAAFNADVEALRRAGNVEAPANLRNPYSFDLPIAPHLAAADAGMSIDLKLIAEAYGQLTCLADWVVVEGAGGVSAPLDDRLDMLDIPRVLDIPVLMVVGLRLGCINHALLTARCIEARGLDLVGWIGNEIEPEIASSVAVVHSIESRLDARCLARIGWEGANEVDWNALANYLQGRAGKRTDVAR